MIRLSRLVVLASSSLLFSQTAFADDSLRCNAEQTLCLTENKRLTIGDQIAIFNKDNEVVAAGEVTGMRDRTRRLKITKRHGRINKGYRVKAIADEKVSRMSEHYTLYRKQPKIVAGAGMGLTTMNIAESSNAFTFEGFGQYRWKRGIQLVARGQFFTASGTAVDPENNFREEEFDVQGISALPGVAYTILPKSKVSFRGEVAAGLTYITRSTSGSSFAKSLDKLEPGIGLAGRTEAAALYNYKSWHPAAYVAFSQITGARATTIGLGLIRDL